MADAEHGSSPANATDGLAAFALASFGLGLGLIYVLERVGAPDAFVQALGPLLAIVGLVAIGAMSRASQLTDFLAARRRIPAFHAGLAFAATAGGGCAALLTETEGAGAAPWRGLALGAMVAALVVAPRWRSRNASSVADILVTRFPSRPTRIVFTLILGAIGLLTSFAGYELALDTLVAALGGNRRLASALAIFTLAATLVPGGLKGLIWSDAASAGAALLILSVGVAISLVGAPDPWAPLMTTFQAAAQRPDMAAWSAEIAAALACAFCLSLAPPAFGAGSGAKATGAGLMGIVIVVVGLAALGIALPQALNLAGMPTTKAFMAAAAALPALALARAGLWGAARAVGLDLATAYQRLTVLSSQRIALIRLGVLFAIASCSYVSEVKGVTSARALYLALAVGLAMATPSLLLTWSPRASKMSALAAVAASAALAFWDFRADGLPLGGADLLVEAMRCGFVGLAAGLIATLVAPERTRDPALRSDPFVDVPVDS